MKGIIALIVLIASYERIVCVDFVDCGTKDASVSSITVSDCTASDQTCPFKSGKNASLDVHFTPNIDSNAAKVELWGIINGLLVPWNVNPSDACKWGISCPMKSGSSQEFKLTVPVSTSYPKIQLTVRVAVVDATSAFLFCKEFPVQIQ